MVKQLVQGKDKIQTRLFPNPKSMLLTATYNA